MLTEYADLLERQAQPVAWISPEYFTAFDRQGYQVATHKIAPDLVPLYVAPPAPQPVAWRDHVEQRLLTWRQRFVNKSGDQLALDDYMDKESLADLLDFMLDEYAAPPAPQPLTDEELRKMLPEPDCWAILTPIGSRLVPPDEAKGRPKSYQLFTADQVLDAMRAVERKVRGEA